MDSVNEKGPAENITTEESKARILKSKRSKDDLQPYVGRDFMQTAISKPG